VRGLMAWVGARGAEVGNGPTDTRVAGPASDPEIAHGRVRGPMTEEFHDAGKAYASAEHECGVGVPLPGLRREDQSEPAQSRQDIRLLARRPLSMRPRLELGIRVV
jgi:hypothetical protein